MLPFNNETMKRICSILIILAFAFPPPAAQASGNGTLPEGTRISLQLNDHLSTKVNNEGDSFTAVVISPVYLGDRIVIPKGSLVAGSISRIIRPGRFRGKAVMNLLFQSLNIPGRGQLPIAASLVSVDSEGNSGVRTENTVEGESSGRGDAGRVVVPGLAGAGIGTLAGGGKGAAIGAGVGAAIGLATVFSTRGKDLQVRRGATMDIALDRPLSVPPEGEGATAKSR